MNARSRSPPATPCTVAVRPLRLGRLGFGFELLEGGAVAGAGLVPGLAVCLLGVGVGVGARRRELGVLGQLLEGLAGEDVLLGCGLSAALGVVLVGRVAVAAGVGAQGREEDGVLGLGANVRVLFQARVLFQLEDDAVVRVRRRRGDGEVAGSSGWVVGVLGGEVCSAKRRQGEDYNFVSLCLVGENDDWVVVAAHI